MENFKGVRDSIKTAGLVHRGVNLTESSLAGGLCGALALEAGDRSPPSPVPRWTKPAGLTES